MSDYADFAQVYDLLTSEIDYPRRAAYFDQLIRRYRKGDGRILCDLGCGSGTLCEAFSQMGYDVIGVDHSPEMLSLALEKKAQSGADITYLCQELDALDLYGTIDVAISTLDSLNHLTDYAQFSDAISRAALFLHPAGVFIFDLNTCYKHEKILANETFVYDYEDVYCVWQNTLKENFLVEMALDIFVAGEDGRYDRLEDAFAERAYPTELVEQALSHAGLKLEAIYEEDSFDPPKADSQRLIFVATHQNPNGRQKILSEGKESEKSS